MIDAATASEQPIAEPLADLLLSTRRVCTWLDTTDRNLRRLIQAGKFPPADLILGRSLRWKESTLRGWMQEQGENGR